MHRMSSGSTSATAGTSYWLHSQWTNPNDIFTILSILGGDVVRKAIGQLAAGPVPYFCPVSFSFGWVRILVWPTSWPRLMRRQVPFAVSAMLSAFGDDRLMPPPELECVLINANSGCARTNRSWLLAHLLRDLDFWMPQLISTSSKPTQPGKEQETNRSKAGLRVTVWRCETITGKGRHDFVYWSGIFVLLVQLLALGVLPLVLFGEYFTIMITACGTVLAWLSGALPQWVEEKSLVRQLSKKKDVLVTEGSGAYEMIMLRAQPGDLDLEALAGSRRDLSNPALTRTCCALLAISWIVLLITVAGWEQHTWYILGVGIIGMIHNIFVAGSERMPAASGIPLEYEAVFADNKVMKVLWKLEDAYPRAGASTLGTFFSGVLNEKEKNAWQFAAERFEHWKSRGYPRGRNGKAVAWTMPNAEWVDNVDFIRPP